MTERRFFPLAPRVVLLALLLATILSIRLQSSKANAFGTYLQEAYTWDHMKTRWSQGEAYWRFRGDWTPATHGCTMADPNSWVFAAASDWNTFGNARTGFYNLHLSYNPNYGYTDHGVSSYSSPNSPNLAQAQWWADANDRIFQAFIRVNCPRIGGDGNLLQQVMRHEFGHWIGLDDLYTGVAYQPQHNDSLMWSHLNWFSWDEWFGTMSAYGPLYIGWDYTSAFYWSGTFDIWVGITSPGAYRDAYDSPPIGNPVTVWDNKVVDPDPGDGYQGADNYLYTLTGYAGEGHQYVYARIAQGGPMIQSGMKLRWHQYLVWDPWMSVDLRFTDGTYARDVWPRLTDQNGYSIHPAERPYYPGGQWLWFEADLTRVAGKTVDTVLVAYDRGLNEGWFLSYFDNVSIGY